MYIPSFNVINPLAAQLHTLIVLHHNVWPEATFHIKIESKGLKNFLVYLCKVSWSNHVWLISYVSRIKEGEDVKNLENYFR